MKKIGYVIYIIIFFIILAIPLTTMALGIENPNYEKRELASMPKLFDENGFNSKFPAQFDSYFADNFGMRTYYTTAYGLVMSSLFNESSNSQVIKGSDGWLYYSSTLNDYMQRDILSDRDIQRLCRILSRQQSYLNEQGIEFIFTVAPNKNTIYPEFMPKRYLQVNDSGNIDRLAAALKNTSVNYLDLSAVLTTAKRENPDVSIYHKTDSHWTNTGALAGYRALMDAIDDSLTDITYDKYETTPFSVKNDWDGDLAAMYLPALQLKDNQTYYDIPKTYKTKTPMGTVEDISINTTSDRNDKKLVFFRDSFGNAIFPFIAENLGEVYFSRAVPYNYSIVRDVAPDVVVLEIVERNISELLDRAPVIYASLLDGIESVADSAVNGVLFSEEAGRNLKIYGYADPSAALDADEIIIRLKNAAGEYTYETFPVLEKAIKEQVHASYAKSDIESCGFSMMTDSTAIAPGTYDVELIINNGSSYRSAVIGSIEITA